MSKLCITKTKLSYLHLRHQGYPQILNWKQLSGVIAVCHHLQTDAMTQTGGWCSVMPFLNCLARVLTDRKSLFLLLLLFCVDVRYPGGQTSNPFILKISWLINKSSKSFCAFNQEIALTSQNSYFGLNARGLTHHWLPSQVCTWGLARANPRSRASAPWAWTEPSARAPTAATSTTWAPFSRPRPPTGALLSARAGGATKGSTSRPLPTHPSWLCSEGCPWAPSPRRRGDLCRVSKRTRSGLCTLFLRKH